MKLIKNSTPLRKTAASNWYKCAARCDSFWQLHGIIHFPDILHAIFTPMTSEILIDALPCAQLILATRNDFVCIENLMQFYMYDFSQWLPVTFCANGLFKISPKDDYLGNPRTTPYLIMVGGDIAGFVTVDDDVNDPGTDHNIGYFLIARRFRGKGLGKAVVTQLLAQHPGVWQIFYITANLGAAQFWDRIIPELSAGKFDTRKETVDGHDCTLYCFRSGIVTA